MRKFWSFKWKSFNRSFNESSLGIECWKIFSMR